MVRHFETRLLFVTMKSLQRSFTRRSVFLVQAILCLAILFMTYHSLQWSYKRRCIPDDLRLHKGKYTSTEKYRRNPEDQIRNLMLPEPNMTLVSTTTKPTYVSPQINLEEKQTLSQNVSVETSDKDQISNGQKRVLNYQRKNASADLTVKALKIVTAFENFHPDEYLAQNKSYFVLRQSVVNDYDPRWLIQASPCPASGLSLLVVVPSVDGHVQQREAIRATWASPAYGRPWPGFNRSFRKLVKLVFFLGVSNVDKKQELVREAELYDDIVQGDFSDSYGNLSLKMAAVLGWSATYCPSARHVMKVDEDTFVNLPLLLYVLKLSSHLRSRYVLGRRHAFLQPIVVRTGRWEVSKEVYPLPYFPRYLYGHSYVISGDAIPSLFNATRHMPLVPNEDSYVTGILAKSADVLRVHSDRFAWLHAKHETPNKCDLVNEKDITQTHFKDASDLFVMWHMIQTGNCSTRPIV